MSHITLGLSGGVDSAVAAGLLKKQGWQVRGIFMKNWEEDDSPGYCAAAQDLAAAQAVAQHLDIELQTVNFSDVYWERVFVHFIAEYQRGRTPNPDILCNSEVKFRAFLDYALSTGSTSIATGHYARLEISSQGVKLLQATDTNKDQTYFLHRLSAEQLNLSTFPVGEITKPEVRRIANLLQLPNAQRKDSTGICFIGPRRLSSFLARYLPHNPGNIETLEGKVIGQHLGLAYYTIGQRQGLGIGGLRGMAEAPWFVAEKDILRNCLKVVQSRTNPSLWHSALEADDWHWIGNPPVASEVLQARIRHRQPLQTCHIVPIDTSRYHVAFAKPQWAIAPGQAVVIYQDQQCLGGGVITSALA